MKKILGMMAALMIVGGVAMAQGGAPVENEPAITCYTAPGGTGDALGNPGQAFKAIKAYPGYEDAENPVEIAEEINASFTVGEAIEQYCEVSGGAEE